MATSVAALWLLVVLSFQSILSEVILLRAACLQVCAFTSTSGYNPGCTDPCTKVRETRLMKKEGDMNSCLSMLKTISDLQ